MRQRWNTETLNFCLLIRKKRVFFRWRFFSLDVEKTSNKCFFSVFTFVPLNFCLCRFFLMITDLEVEEINLLKRKAESESNSASSPPPAKLIKLTIDLASAVEIYQEFNSYQYWKDPLPDIKPQLNTGVCQMICDNWLLKNGTTA